MESGQGSFLMRVLFFCYLYTCIMKSQDLGVKLVIFEALLKAFSVLDVLETCRIYLLSIDLGIVKCIKKVLSGFLNNGNL